MTSHKVIAGTVAGLILFYEYTPHMLTVACQGDEVCASMIGEIHLEIGSHIERSLSSTAVMMGALAPLPPGT